MSTSTQSQTKRQYRNRAWWLAHIHACDRSDLSRAEYCQQHHINLSSLSNWYTKLKEKPAEPNACPNQKRGEFIELVANQELPKPHEQHSVDISLGDISIRVNISTPELLTPWVTALRSCR